MKTLLLALLLLFTMPATADEYADVMANDGEWTKVNIAGNYTDPVIFAGATGVLVGIRNVTADSFEIRIHSCTGETIGSTYVPYHVVEKTFDLEQKFLHDGC